MKITAAVLLLLCSCTGVDPLVVTGESLDGLSYTFEDTGLAMNAGLRAGTISVEQYRLWAAFAKRFKATYRLAVDLWHAAVLTQDKATERDVVNTLVRLAGDLAAFRIPPKADGGT